jgi:hypothetical protein
MTPLIPASLLNFLSGLAVGAGINLVTSIEGGSTFPKIKIIIDSVIWFADSVLLAYAAHLAEVVEREAALVIDRTLTREERRAILRDEMSRVRVPYLSSIVIGTIGIFVALYLVPGIGA